MSVETENPCSAERKEMTFPIQNVSDYPTEFPEIHTLPSRRVSRPSHFRSPSAHNRPRFLPLRFSYNSTEALADFNESANVPLPASPIFIQQHRKAARCNDPTPSPGIPTDRCPATHTAETRRGITDLE